MRTALVEVLHTLFPGHRLVRARRLTGGLWAHTHALDLVPRTAVGELEPLSLALRRYVRWAPERGTDGSCRRHAAALRALQGTPVGSPRLHWADPDGVVLDVPALLCQLLPGRAWLPTAAAPAGLDVLAGALAAVHAADVQAPELGDRTSFGERVERALQDDSLADELRDCPLGNAAQAGLRAHADHATTAPVRLSHGDFHPGNVLLTGRGRRTGLGGVVDWDVVGWRPVGADLGYCRLDLTLSSGEGPADHLTAAYLRSAGGDGPIEPRQLAWFDLVAAASSWGEHRQWLPGYHVLGRPGLTADELTRRLLRFAESALSRLR